MNITDLTPTDGTSFNDLLTVEQEAFQFAAPFNEDEREWFRTHWLQVTGPQLANINGILEAAQVETRCWPVQDSENQYIGSDLLTETFSQNQSHYRVRAELRALPIYEWTEPVEEEPEE